MSHAEVSHPKTWTTLGDREVRQRSGEPVGSSSAGLQAGCLRSRYVWAKQRREPGQLDFQVQSLNSHVRRSQRQRLKLHFAIYCTAKSLRLPSSPLSAPIFQTGDRDSSPKPKDLAQFRSTRRSPATSSDNLRQTLIDYFQGQAATFDFWAQLQAKLLPLTTEDPTLGWQDQSPSDYPVTIIELSPAQRS